MKRVCNQIHAGIDPYADFQPYEYDGFGWNSNDTSFKDVIESVKPNLIVEVGTWLGASAVNMANICFDLGIERSKLEIVCVDTWLGSVEHFTMGSLTRKNGHPVIYEQFLSNIIHKQLTDVITPFPIDSINAHECLKAWDIKPDMIYIDAAHDYQSVKLDVFVWSQVLRSGGWMLFDDWHHEPIRRAVHEVFGEDKVFEVGGKAAWVK